MENKILAAEAMRAGSTGGGQGARKKVDTVLFDFDGTLVNTNQVIIESWQHIYKHYYGAEKPVDHIVKYFGEPLLPTIEREFPEVSSQEAMALYRRYQEENAERLVHVFPGIYDLLKDLKENQYEMAIVTSRTKSSTEQYLEMLNLKEFFSHMVTCDDTSIHKPNPEPIFCALEKLGKKAETAIMVGDGPFDMKCANNAGLPSVLVGWRITGDNHMIDDWRADFTIEKPEDLKGVLREIEL